MNDDNIESKRTKSEEQDGVGKCVALLKLGSRNKVICA